MRGLLAWLATWGVIILVVFVYVYALTYPSIQLQKECEMGGGIAVKSTEGYTCIDASSIRK